MREWSIRLVLLDDKGNEVPANIFDKVTFKLHPTFANPTRVIKKQPFMLSEQGWGEFDLQVILHTIDKGGDHILSHDLNFQKPKYEAVHPITFTNPRPQLREMLAESGPLPSGGEVNGAGKRDKRKAGDDSAVKKKSRNERVSNPLGSGASKLLICGAVRYGEACRWLAEVERG